MNEPVDATFGQHDDVLWWLADPTETIQRASHAIAIDDRRLAIDPVDCPGLDDRLESAGGIDGVAVLMDRHARDARAIAARHGVPVYVPAEARRIAAAVGGPVVSLEVDFDETGVDLRWVVSNRFQEEVALWRPRDGTLLVPESIGTARYFCAGGERIGIHPIARLRPPVKSLGGLDANRLFVGHGPPVVDLEPGEIDASLANARRRLPRAWLTALAGWIR